MRCKACDVELWGVNRAFKRVVELEDGKKLVIDEDLCRDCRSAIFKESDPEDFDLMEALGYDIDSDT